MAQRVMTANLDVGEEGGTSEVLVSREIPREGNRSRWLMSDEQLTFGDDAPEACPTEPSEP